MRRIARSGLSLVAVLLVTGCSAAARAPGAQGVSTAAPAGPAGVSPSTGPPSSPAVTSSRPAHASSAASTTRAASGLDPRSSPAAPASASAVGRYTLPPINAMADYQLGGAYPPARGVSVVVRDRADSPAAGHYNVCYVNAFQTQTAELGWWTRTNPDLLLTRDGKYVVDQEWSENLLDISTPSKRARLAAIVGSWIDGCRRAGFQAVEPDNLDSWTRSDGLLTATEAVAYVRLLAARAHADGLAIAQKNAVELAGRRAQTGLDFAIAEECMQYDECGAYATAFSDHVLVIEYDRSNFTAACRRWPQLSVVLRDVDLVPVGESGYLRDAC